MSSDPGTPSTNDLFQRWAQLNTAALEAEERLARAGSGPESALPSLREWAAALREDAEGAKRQALDQFNAELRARGLRK